APTRTVTACGRRLLALRPLGLDQPVGLSDRGSMTVDDLGSLRALLPELLMGSDEVGEFVCAFRIVVFMAQSAPIGCELDEGLQGGALVIGDAHRRCPPQ